MCVQSHNPGRVLLNTKRTRRWNYLDVRSFSCMTRCVRVPARLLCLTDVIGINNIPFTRSRLRNDHFTRD